MIFRMSVVARGYVGTKGEIYIEKRGREASGLKPKDELLVIISKGKIEIIRIPKLEDILNKTPLVEIEDKEIEIISQEFQREHIGD